MKKFLSALFVSAVFVFSFAFFANAQEEKKWETFITGAQGSNVLTTQAYGYYIKVKGFGDVFVICDPDNGSETGYAYVPGMKVGQKTSQVIKEYERGLIEDFTVTKRLDPIEVSLFAPNTWRRTGLTDYSWEYASQTGKYIDVANTPLGWPGTTRAFLLPSAKPNYWLMVAQATNPNPFPVKSDLFMYVSKFTGDPRRYKWFKSGTPAQKSYDDIYFAANETKYILLNNAVPTYHTLVHDLEWDDDDCEVWAEGYWSTGIAENLDPEHPEWLKPAYGVADIDYYVGGYYRINEPPKGFSVSYSVTAKPSGVNSRSPNYWYFVGSVYQDKNTGKWTASANAAQSKNISLATQEVTKLFNNHSVVSEIPQNLDDDDDPVTIDGIKLYRCQTNYLITTPETWAYDLSGPALMDPSSLVEDIELNDGGEPMARISCRPGYFGWDKTSLPGLEYEYVFLETFKFIGTEDNGNIGYLSKEIKPGVFVQSELFDRPHLSSTETINSYSAEITPDGQRIKAKINMDITITANNTEDFQLIVKNTKGITSYFAPLIFYRSPGYLENIIEDIVKLYAKREHHLDSTRSVEIEKFTHFPVMYLETMNVAKELPSNTFIFTPNSSQVLYNGNFIATIELDKNFSVRYKFKKNGNTYTGNYTGSLNEANIIYMLQQALAFGIEDEEELRDIRYPYSRTVEARFVSNGSPFQVEVIDTASFGSKNNGLASLGQYIYYTKERDKDDGGYDYDYFTRGVNAPNKFLTPLSYFKSGIAMEATDDLYKLVYHKVMTMTESEMSQFYPTVTFATSSGKTTMNVNLNFEPEEDD